MTTSSGRLAVPRAPLDDAPSATSRLRALEGLSDVAVRIAGSVALEDTLQAVAAAVVDTVGFDVAVLNLVDGDVLRVAVVLGPPEARAALTGARERRAVWETMLARSTPLGSLRFVDGRGEEDDLDGLLAWVPDLPVTDDAGDWHPQDALFAPLHGSSGELLGVLSVDLPRDGRRPDAARVELLERCAALAALAVERASMHQRVADSAELFHRTFEDAPIGMALLTLAGRVEQANATYAAMAGGTREELVGVPCWELVHPDDRTAVRAGLRLVAAGRLPVARGDVRDVTGRSWSATTASRIDGPGGPRLLVQALDVTDQRRATAALHERAVRDPLTGLRNRGGLASRLSALLARARGDGESGEGDGRVAVLFCDVDRFKLVNDTYGHAVGDELLVHVADGLRAELGPYDVAARLGGDEFVVVLADCDGAAGAIATAERLRAAACRPLPVHGAQVVPSVSIGIALAELGSTADGLVAAADAALYRAKAAGRGRWELFAEEMRDSAVARLRLREELAGALARGELRLHYQPVVELATGVTAGYEALLRWEHPERGLLLPGAFLDELMHGDLGAAATDWVVERAVADAASWPQPYGRPLVVSVNVGPAQLARPDLPARVLSALQRSGLPPERLWIEVTEEAAVNGEVELAALEALRAGGVHVALDDFGSGFAGLLALRSVPADVVKLDRAFTLGLHDDPTTLVIVQAVVALCAALGRRLVAEGLETAEHVETVRRLGITDGQGWHLGRPAPLPGRTAPEAPAPLLVTCDLTGELRRVDAALAAARDEVDVARIALQAARRVAAVDGGSVVLRSAPGWLRTVHAEGYPTEVVERFRTFTDDAPLPLATAVVDGAPVWMGDHEVVQDLHVSQGLTPRVHVALAALPLHGADEVLGGLGVSWTRPVVLDAVVRAQLLELARHVGQRLAVLTGGR